MSKPEVQFLAVTRADGSLAIMQFVTKARGYEREPTDKNIAVEVARHPKNAGATWRRMDPAEIPQDRQFRDAWADRGDGITVDMPKARKVHRGRMRVARVAKLAALDVEYQRADERADVAGKADIAKRKQALRDVTADPAIEAAKTPDELRAVWPAVLA